MCSLQAREVYFDGPFLCYDFAEDSETWVVEIYRVHQTNIPL